jgi:Na+/glutamate symporter
MSQPIPALPGSLSEPRPVVITGTILWIVFAVATFADRDYSNSLWQVGACGVGVGVLGAAVLTLQRRAARRGTKGAQRGLA